MDKRKILIIHLSRLGDMVQSLPAVKLLKEDLTDSIVTYLGIEEFCGLLDDIQWIDRLVTLPWQEIRTVMEEGNEIDIAALERLLGQTPEMNEDYSLLINLTHNRASSYLTERVRAKEKQGRVFSQNNEIVVSGKWGKYLFAMARNQRDNLLNLVDIYMGMAGVDNRQAGQLLANGPDEDDRYNSILPDLGLEGDRYKIGFQLGTNKLDKMWPLENFVKLGESLSRSMDAQIILFGSEKERGLADEFQGLATYRFVDLVGKTTLKELASFFKRMDVVVGGDTGPLHVAAAVGTRVVGIFTGIAYFGLTGAYGSGHVAIQSNYPCAPCVSSTTCAAPLCRESVTPETVADGVKLCLGLDDRLAGADYGASVYQSYFTADGVLRYRLVSQSREGFPAWLKSFSYSKALVSQALWNDWLGLGSGIDPDLVRANGDLGVIVSEFRKGCLAFRGIYETGTSQCQKIIREFKKKRPNIQLVQMMVESIKQTEGLLKTLEGPLAILKDMHEYYMAETKMCEFPELAYQFLEKYTALKDTVAHFEATLERIINSQVHASS